jgi:flagellar biosynthesis protein FliQ
MTTDSVLDLTRQALVVILSLSLPILLTALVVGLLVGMFQAATQINEMTLSFIPKMIAVVIAILIFGPWMLQMLVSFTERLFHNIPTLIGT